MKKTSRLREVSVFGSPVPTGMGEKGRKEDQDRIDLQTPDQHGKGQCDLGEIGEHGEISQRTGDAEPRTDVAQTGKAGRDGGFHVKVVQGYDQQDDHQDQDVTEEVTADLVDDVLVDHLAIHRDDIDLLRMQQALQVQFGALEQYGQTADLQTACGRSGTGTDDHQREQDHLGKHRPQIEIRRGITGRRDHRGNLEEGVAKCLQQGAVIQREDVECDHHHTACDDQQIHAQFFIAEDAADVFDQQKVEHVEVDAKQQHEHGDHHLQINAVIEGDAGVLDGKTAGTGRTEGRAQRIEQRHAAQQQEEDHDRGQHQIDLIENGCALPQTGHQLADDWSRCFCPHDVHHAVVGAGDDGEQKDEDAHTADPVCEAAPEQRGVGECLDIGQDAGTGRGKSGDRFKETVHQGRDLAAEEERKSSEEGKDDPGQANGDHAFLCKIRMFGF